MIKSLPSKGGDSGSTPGQGTEVPHASGAAQLSPCTLEPCAATKTQHSQKLKKKKKNDVISFWLGRVSSLES